MRMRLGLAVLLAGCGPADTGRTTAATGLVTASGGTTGTSGGASTGAATGEAATGDVTTTGAETTAAASTSTTDATTGAAVSTSTTGATTGLAGSTGAVDSTGSDTAGVSCPPEGEMDCSPGPGSGEGDTCVLVEPCFRKTVQDAIKQVLAGHPEWFMHDDMGDLVLEVELYMNTVVEVVAAAGLCAIRDPNAGDEIAVKYDNSYAENFDILTAAGYVRSGDGIYTSTCIPAWF